MGVAKFIDCKYVFIPFKARKDQPLTTFQKAINQCLASVRVAVENSIAQLKAFFVLRIENRMRKKEKLADAFSLCAELSCFKQCYANTWFLDNNNSIERAVNQEVQQEHYSGKKNFTP